MYSSHQINCSPSKTIQYRTPLDLYNTAVSSHVHPFKYDRLKPFGCLAFAHDRHQLSKVGPVAKRFIFVGIKPSARAWRLWDKTTKRIFVTGDAEFRETFFPAAEDTHSPDISRLHLTSEVLEDILTTAPDCTYSPIVTLDQPLNTAPLSTSDPDSSNNHLNNSSSTTAPTHHHAEEIIDSPIDTPTPPPRRTARTMVQPQRYGFETSVSPDSDHPTFAQAMASPDKAAWKKAMQD